MALERGTLLHKRYRIVEILGQGGMGSVYRALDENLGVEIALKENLFTTDEYARQFRLEAVILANLRHPNLPRVTDHFVIGTQGQYLVMDYIEGEDLRQRMERQGTISEEEAILIGAAICDALEYLHNRKPAIIHRDVKPGNVKITPSGEIYLVDFGLAKLVKGSQATTTGARAMTPGYSPPEQYGTARTDPRTDIYSLGATLYAGLSDAIPEDALARAMDNVDLTPLRKRNSRISRRLAAAIEKSMAIRPEDRYQTPEEFKAALLASNVKTQKIDGEFIVEPPPMIEGDDDEPEPGPSILTGDRPITAQLVPVSQPISRPRKKKGWTTGCWVSFSFFLMTILAGMIALMVLWSPFSPSVNDLLGTTSPGLTSRTPGGNGISETDEMQGTPPPIELPTATPFPTPTEIPSPTPTPTEILTPVPTPLGGSGQIVFASSRAGVPQLFLMDGDGSNPIQLTNLIDGACQPSWSPDGMFLVFISPCLRRQDQYSGASLFVIKVDGTGLVPLPSSQNGDFDPAWSPDGRRIAFTSLRSGNPQIYILDLSDNSVTRLTQSSTDTRFPEWSRQPAWSMSGTQIAYTAWRVGVTQLWFMSDTGQGQTQLVRSGNEYWDSSPVWLPDGETIIFDQTRGAQALGWLMILEYSQRDVDDGSRIRNGTYATDAHVSPDGRWIVFESTENGINWDIYRMTVDGVSRVTLASDPGLDFDPAWSPVFLP